MLMFIKQGVSIVGCRTEILVAAISIIDPVFREFGQEAVITSGTEKYKHSVKRSRHYDGSALDFRHRFFTLPQKNAVLQQLTERLGKHFVVVLESTHFHIHYAPVYED